MIKYILAAPIVLIIMIYAIKVQGKSLETKIADRLYKIRKICDDKNLYFLNHNSEENKLYAAKIAKASLKHIEQLKVMVVKLPDSSVIKEPLFLFVQKWNLEKITSSVSGDDDNERFISDNNGLISLFPSRWKKTWKPLFPIYKP